jgi:hypothetical protein
VYSVLFVLPHSLVEENVLDCNTVSFNKTTPPFLGAESNSHLLIGGILLGLLLDTHNGGDAFLRIVSGLLLNYMAL